MTDCLFCRIASGEIPARIVHQDDTFVAFEDINPQAPVHILIIPRRHLENLNALGPDDAGLAGGAHLLARELARQRGIAETGYRVVVNCGSGAGQTVFHLHFHLLGGRGFSWPPG